MVDLLADRIDIGGADLQVVQLVNIGRTAGGTRQRQVEIAGQRRLAVDRRQHVDRIEAGQHNETRAAITLHGDPRLVAEAAIHGDAIGVSGAAEVLVALSTPGLRLAAVPAI